MINPFSTPVYVMPKPVGSTCNMACTYCYYLEKKRYYPDARRQMMSEATLEEFVKQYIAAQTTPDVIFYMAWRGGYGEEARLLSQGSGDAEEVWSRTQYHQLPSDQRYAAHR